MRTGKRLVHGLVIGISMFICLTGVLANPSDSQLRRTPSYTTSLVVQTMGFNPITAAPSSRGPPFTG